MRFLYALMSIRLFGGFYPAPLLGMDYIALAFIRLFRNSMLTRLLHLGHFMISSASFADTMSINLLLEQTGHLTFTAIRHHLPPYALYAA